jgi:beta-lactamase regulating signal transducer with metallopeptidase domain
MSTPQLAAAFAVLVDAALRGSLILLAALAATRLMKRRTAAARHLVWVVALASMLALPLLSRVLPAWRVVPVPAPLRPVTSFVAAPVAAAPPVVSALREGGAESSIDAPSTAALLPSSSGEGIIAHPAASPAAPAAPVFDWKTALMAVWIVGGAALALRLAYGMVRVFWMERRAVEITDDGWVRIADGLARRLRVGRMVTLLREAHAVVPMTWGVVRPVVLLPADAEEWDTERRTVVLAHELAHVRRWDTLTQWIAHLALALFWFNPLVWMAARQMREEREHACDDAVLSIGTRPVEYADHLLDIVRSLGAVEGPAAALAMARRSQFEGRLLAILDSATPRGGVSRGLGFAALALAAAAVLPLGALRAALPPQGGEPAVTALRAEASSTAERSASKPVAALSKGTFAGIAGKVGAIVDRAVGALPLRDTSRAPAPALPGAPASAASAAGAASSPYGGTAPQPPLPPVSPPPAPTPSSVSAIASALGTSQDRVAAMLQDSGGYGDVIRAAAGIGASAEKASVLLAVLRQPDLSATDLAALLRVAGGISADPERRDVLREAARRYPLAQPAVRRAFFGAAAAFAACPERRDVLLAVLARNADAEVVSAVILSARAMATEAERRDVLLKVVEKTGSPELLGQVVAAARELVSSAARRDVLVKVLGRPGLPSSVLRAAFGAAAEITASAEKRDVLRYGAESQRLDAAAREAYLSAANTITASAERAEAISALLGERSAAAAPKPAAPSGTRATYDLVADDGTWNSDLVITQDGGRVVRLRTVNVVRGAAADDIRSIRRGGSLMVEETRSGRTRRVDMVPGTGGTIVRTFKVDGQPRPFDAEAARWLSSILREFTATSR